MLRTLEKAIRVEQLINPGDRILCAVSGGADSVALLTLLKQLSAAGAFSLYAAHLDHRLRPESGDDANFVAALCVELQVPLFSESIDVQQLSGRRREGLEAAGRFARRRFFEKIAREQECTSIALAHHADDQAETVLFRLARGSGLTGLAAMRHRSGLYIRPLLDFKKVELRDWLIENGIVWREDVSNLDLKFSRNLIRNQILPALRQINTRTDEAFCRFNRQVALEEDFWSEQVDDVLSRHLQAKQVDNSLQISVESLLTLHPALRRRVIRGMVERLRGDLQRFEATHIDQVEALLVNPRPQVETCLPGVWVARRYEILELRLEPPDIEPFELNVMQEGEYDLPGGDRIIVVLQHDSDPAAGTSVVEFCADQIGFPLTIRSARPGDRFQPSGMVGHKRLKNYFIDNKIPHEVRQKVPVVCSGETILWLVGERRCEGAWPVKDRLKLHMRLEQAVFVDE